MIPKTNKKKIKFLFDLDGTITTEELLPKLAKELGFFDEMKLLTKLTLNGDIPFDASFRLRVEILRQVGVERVKPIIQTISLSEEIVAFIKANQNHCELLRQADFGIGYGGVHSIPQSLQEVAQAAVYDPGILCNLLNQLLSHVQELAPALG
jgi:hypothetical protein